jgi:hypothetical protein
MALPEFEANGLLPDGVHQATREELRERCVAPFATSITREAIFMAFARYQDDLAMLSANVTQWVDGSFTDQTRTDPEDVDVVNYVKVENLNAMAAKHGEAAVEALLGGREATKVPYKTHSFLVVAFPPGHRWEAKFEEIRQYWRKWFSTPQDYSQGQKVPAPGRGRKGIVQMTVGEAKLCPEVRP